MCWLSTERPWHASLTGFNRDTIQCTTGISSCMKPSYSSLYLQWGWLVTELCPVQLTWWYVRTEIDEVERMKLTATTNDAAATHLRKTTMTETAAAATSHVVSLLTIRKTGMRTVWTKTQNRSTAIVLAFQLLVWSVCVIAMTPARVSGGGEISLSSVSGDIINILQIPINQVYLECSACV